MTLIRRPIVLLAPVAVLLVLLAMSTNVLPIRQIIDQREEIAATQDRLGALVDQNAALDAQLRALDTPAEVERLARDELGYVRPGETAYIVMRPDGSSATAQPAPREVTPVESSGPDARSPSPLGQLWDFLTGRDLEHG